MVETFQGLDRLPDAMRPVVMEYGRLLQRLGGDNCLAVTFYGAVVSDRWDSTRHTAQNVLVLREVDLEMLRKLAEHGRKLGKDYIRAPIVMTPDYIRLSLDTFPLELIEIQQQHVTLFGEEYFKDLEFKPDDVRHQCERELKAAMISLRQGLLAAAGRDKALDAAVLEIDDGFARTARGILWLKEIREPKSLGAVLGDLEKVLERKLPGIRAGLTPGGDSWEKFRRLYADVEMLSKWVDEH